MKRRSIFSIAATLVVGAVAFACSLDGGSIVELAGNDAAASSDSTSADGTTSSDGNVVGDSNIGPDGNTTLADAGAPDSGIHTIFATTKTQLYILNVDSKVLKAIGTFSTCGLSGFDTVDVAQDSKGVVGILTWKNSGSFSYYALERDGGCVDVHGGAGVNQGGSNMWVGYQGGATDTLYSLIDNDTSLLSYNDVGDYIGTVNGVFDAGGATADIACSSTLCYSALAHDHCVGSSDSNDCLVSFDSSGASLTTIGNFGKSGVTGVAYSGGFIYGFFSDGSIVKISTTPTSTGVPITTLGVSNADIAWQGAGSSSANP